MKTSLHITLAACVSLLICPLTASAVDNLAVSAEAGIGYDSNAYRTPDNPYFDVARGVNVVPNVQTGIFVPLQLKADYEAASFLATYAFKGDVFFDNALENANRYDNDVTLGKQFALQQGRLEGGSVYAGFVAGYHKRTYFDRDSGLDQVTTLSGTNVSNRYTYVNYGIEAELDHSVNDIDYSIATELVKRNYDNPVRVSELDHLYFKIGGDAQFALSNIGKLKLGYTFAYRDYDDRPSHLANGTYPAVKVPVEYSYHIFDAILWHQFSEGLVAYLDYTRTFRNDGFVGYNDYTKDEVKVRTRLKLSDELKLRAWAAWRNRNYPNAFAFNVAGQAEKDYDSIRGAIQAEYDLAGMDLAAIKSNNLSVWGEINFINQDSTDLRYAYDRYQLMAGVRWEL